MTVTTPSFTVTPAEAIAGVWCQEEPLNMGAWSFMQPRLNKIVGQEVRYAGRDRASSPATGSKAVHKREQKMLCEEAFSV